MDRISFAINGEATAFFELAKREYKSYSYNVEKINEKEFYKMIPIIVNFALSIELFLKGFQDTTRGHDLKKLFLNTPEWVQQIITERFIVQFQITYNTVISEKEFFSLLKANSLAFEDWRYYYERGNSVSISFLYIMAKVLNSLYTTILGRLKQT